MKDFQRIVKTYNEIYQEWEKIQSLDFKNRVKAMKSLAFDIGNAYQNNQTELIQLEFYIKLLREINRIHDMPRSKKMLSKLITDWLTLTGNSEVKILKKIAGKLDLDSACISICDQAFSEEIANAYDNYAEKNILKLINEGKGYIFSTGADSSCPFQVRVINALEPVLSANEFKCVVNTAEQAIISLPTGLIKISDPCFLDSDTGASLQIDPGNYKVMGYHFYIRNKLDSFYIVLCKTDIQPINNLTRISELG